MTYAAVATKIHQALQIHLIVPTKVPFHRIVSLKNVANGSDLSFGEFIRSNVLINASFL